MVDTALGELMRLLRSFDRVINGTAGKAPFTLTASAIPDANVTTGTWRNFTLNGSAGYEFFVQTTDGSPLTNYAAKGMCGSDPHAFDHGLCQTCATSLYAMSYDCTGTAHCVFGVSGAASKVKLLVGSSQGIQVTAFTFDL